LGKSVWPYALLRRKVEVLRKLWECGKATVTAEELNNNLLFAKDSDWQTPCHVAAKDGNLEMLQKVWQWARGKLTAEELSNKFLLAHDKVR
jgi:hypothetical protein